MEETLTRRVLRCRLVAFAFTLAVLLSGIAAAPVHAQGDPPRPPIFSWGGTLDVSTTTLEIPEGGAATYDLRLTQQPTSMKKCGTDDKCGWWVLLRVDDTEDTDDTVSWIPSVGWEFTPQGGSGPTSWRGISIRAVEDDDTEDEVIIFRHEVWDENGECPDHLHPDNLPVVTVRIIDNDRDGGGSRSNLSIADTPVVEGDSARFNVSLTPESSQEVTVSWATADETAKAGADYKARTGTLTFPAGATLQTISVPTVEDAFHEPEERFRVTLSSPSGATLADYTGEATISDDDLPELSIGNASPVTEGRTARFVVTLTPRSEQTVTVDYRTVDGTASAGSDYTGTTGTQTLTFTAGQTTRTIEVPTTDDMEQESDERFTVTLSVSSHFELINSGRVSVHRAGCLVRRRLDEEEDDGCGRCAKLRLRGFANSCGRGCLRPQEWRRPQPPELAGSDSFG